MRHGNKLKKLGREASHRKAMIKNLATSILKQGLHEEQMDRQVRTTVPKAKAVRSLVERLITYGKKGDLAAKKLAAKHIHDKEVFTGLFDTLGERYKERNGGYTRILKLSSNRHGDNAEMAVITLVEDEVVAKKKKKKKAKKAAVAKPAKVEEKAEAAAEEATTDEVKSDDAPAVEEKAATEAPAPEAKTEAKTDEPKKEEPPKAE